MKYIFLALLLMVGAFSAQSQLVINIYPTEQELIKSLLATDRSVKISNISFGGAKEARGIFSNYNTPLPLDSGVLLTTGFATGAKGKNNQQDFSGANRMKGDKDIHFLAGYKTYDACYLSFDLITSQNLLKFNYVFGSEEYPEYASSPFNDMFAFILTDKESGEAKNLAVIPNTSFPIMVNTLNHRTYSNFYIDNSGPTVPENDIQYDGFTQRLIAFAEVKPNKKYRIKIVIADVGDDALDSGVFIEGKSFASIPAEEFYYENKVYFQKFSNNEKFNDTIELLPKELKSKQTPNTVEVAKKTKINSQINKDTYTDSVVIYFEFDKVIPIPESAQNGLKKLNDLNANHYILVIKGHTDQVGSLDYNLKLSLARAKFIEKLITKNFSSTTTVNWFAFNQPVTKMTSTSARAKNRRVVIYLKAKN